MGQGSYSNLSIPVCRMEKDVNISHTEEVFVVWKASQQYKMLCLQLLYVYLKLYQPA